MSFSRLVFALLTLLLAVLLVVSFALSVAHSRQYLSRQLAVHAQDTATALGLTLASALHRGDRATVASLVKAVADGGYFHRIRVVETNGSVAAERWVTLKIAGVPAWFVRWLPLETPTRVALIMDGWREAGRVEVSSHPGFAYQQLWDDARALLLWFGLAGAIALVSLMWLARSALKPLAAMERQAIAIGAGRFVTNSPLPWARELRRVAVAMNQMANKVDGMLTDKVKTIENIEIASHRDALTGLYTRSFLNDQIALFMREAGECESAALLLIRLGDLGQVNTQWGYDEGNALLRQLAALLRGQEQHLQGAIAARAGGSEFMLLVRETTPEEARALADTLLAQLRELTSPLGARISMVHIGIGFRDGAMNDPSKLFAQADMALRSAESRGRHGTFIYPPDDISHDVTFGAMRWRQIIETALARNQIILFEQPILRTTTGTPVCYELLARIRDENGRLIGAGSFMPMAHRLGLAIAIDRAVVELALAQSFPDAVPRVVNLSVDAIRDLVFTTWLLQRLRDDAVDASRIVFELPERAAAEAPESVSALVSRFEVMGIRFGFDHVGTTPEALARIRHLRPMFLKCDETLLIGSEARFARHSLLEMLRELAQALDSVFIAAGVENSAHLDTCRAMGAAALQGRILGLPCAVGATQADRPLS